MPVPIIVGVSDIKNISLAPDDAREPAMLMQEAILAALEDTSIVSTLLTPRIDSLAVVRTWTWPYSDLPGLLAERLGLSSLRHKIYTEHGGNSPARILDETAQRISRGDANLGVIVGGEALASLAACVKAGLDAPLGWTPPSEDPADAFALDLQRAGDNVGTRHAVGLPIHVYPMYENAFRARRSQSIRANNEESTKLYAEFARIAAQNQNSWNYGRPAAAEHEIGTVSKKNRMICFPYPLLMNAFNNVNLAAAAIVTSTEMASQLGIPKSKWIYPLGGAGTQDSEHFWKRPNFHTSPSISRSLDAALELSGLQAKNIDLFDFYSCFPIVPKLACEHLRIPIDTADRPLTLLGGLTSFGGAGNNYSMHTISEMVRQLRRGPSKTGLILANGGTLTYQHAICLSTQARHDGTPYPDRNPLPKEITDIPIPEIAESANGEAVIETYTVAYSRSNKPAKAFIVGRLVSDNTRFVANHADTSTLQQLASSTLEPIGRRGMVMYDASERRNLFALRESGEVKL